jgi:hypothetical protein
VLCVVCVLVCDRCRSIDLISTHFTLPPGSPFHCYITLDEKEDLIQQLMADIDAAAAQQSEQGPRAAETSTEGSAEENFVPCSR